MSENQSSEMKNTSREKSRSLFKLCPHCKKKSKMLVIKHSKEMKRVSTFLLKLFSPGGTQINQRYKCPRCTHEFNDMSFAEAAIVPIILITVVILSVVLFLSFVFYVVAK